jgi:hypothetical protein
VKILRKARRHLPEISFSRSETRILKKEASARDAVLECLFSLARAAVAFEKASRVASKVHDREFALRKADLDRRRSDRAKRSARFKRVLRKADL